jgi:2-succinyl-6-hydroxy-2,4-cyclohexadiene-1-carboxylate synthase
MRAYVGRVALASERTGAGEPRLVLVHGFTQTARSWRPITDDLSRDHEVVTVDLPGHGDSGDERADLWATADLVVEAGGPAVYVGYSLGGRVCLHVALRHPDQVRGLVLIGATGGLETESARADRRAADDRLAATIEEHGVDPFLDSWLAQPIFARLKVDDDALADRKRNSAAGLAASLRTSGTGTQQPLWDQLGSVKVPALVMAGEYDVKFRQAAARLCDVMRPYAQQSVVPGAGHAAHLEQPKATLALIRQWLRNNRW